MVRFGRASITTGIFGYLAVWSVAAAPVRGYLDAVPAAYAIWNGLAAAAALGLFIGWGLGVYHWGARYTGKRKALWGVAVIPGAFLGALAYWWLGAEHHS